MEQKREPSTTGPDRDVLTFNLPESGKLVLRKQPGGESFYFEVYEKGGAYLNPEDDFGNLAGSMTAATLAHIMASAKLAALTPTKPATPLWEDTSTAEQIQEHFGYTDPAAVAVTPHGYWPKDEMAKRLCAVPDFLRLLGAENKRFRITIDHDPEFPWALFVYQTISG